MKCLNCNKELVQVPGKREKHFCDSTCRSNYWQKKQRLEKLGFGMPVDPFNKFSDVKTGLPTNKAAGKPKEIKITPKDFEPHYDKFEIEKQIESIASETKPSFIGSATWERNKARRISDLKNKL